MAPKDMVKVVGQDGFDLEAFQLMIQSETDKRLHIVDVYTTWCGPCVSLVPTFKNLQVNVDYFEDRCTITQCDRTLVTEYADRFPQTSKPRFLFFKFGQEVREIEGLKAPEILKVIH